MNTLSSIPGALLFRSVMVVILVLIMIVIFLSYTSGLTRKAAEIERNKVIYELDTVLSYRLYSAAIKGRLSELTALHQQNPFVVLADENYTVPSAYVGEVNQTDPLQQSGWYFDTSKHMIFYWEASKVTHRYQMQFKFNDLNASGIYESNADSIEKLGMVKKEKSR